jgi:hypothetical protein
MQEPFRKRGTRSAVLTAVVNLIWRVGTESAMIAPVLGLILAGLPAAVPALDALPDSGLIVKSEMPALDALPDSGLIVKSEVIVIWMPRALHDLARRQAGPLVNRFSEELHAYLGQNGWRAGWYALRYRCHQVNGESTEITQIRRLSEAADHLDELEDVMAAAAGRPPRYEAFSHARVEIIPDTLQAVDPREAITRLMADPIVGDGSSPTGCPGSTRRTD